MCFFAVSQDEIFVAPDKNCLNFENHLLPHPGFFNVAIYGIFPVWFKSAQKLIGSS